MMALKKKIRQNGAKSSPNKSLKPSGRRRDALRSSPGKMSNDILAKLIIGIVTGLLLLGLIISFLVPSSPRNVTKTPVSYENKLQYAREKCREGKALIGKADSSSSD